MNSLNVKYQMSNVGPNLTDLHKTIDTIGLDLNQSQATTNECCRPENEWAKVRLRLSDSQANAVGQRFVELTVILLYLCSPSIQMNFLNVKCQMLDLTWRTCFML